MRLPRDLSGSELARRLASFGYRITRQTGSHMRLTTLKQGEHHITIPKHDEVHIGTLVEILDDVAVHLTLTRDELAERLFSKGR